MRNAFSNMGLPYRWATVAFFAAMLWVGSAFTNRVPSPEVSCQAPNVGITNQGSNNVTFQWSAVSGAQSYKAWYVRKNDNSRSDETGTTGTSLTFTGLPTGEYTFYFATVCSAGFSEWVGTDVVFQ